MPSGGFNKTLCPDRDRDRIVGQVLRELRQDAGMSTAAVSRLPGAPDASILGAYERGERTVSVERLYQIADVYGVVPRVLLSVIEARCEVLARRALMG